MQIRLQYYVQRQLDKTPALLLESVSGVVSGVFAGVYCYNHFSDFSFINMKDFTDRLITICSILFGFLLTVLTLIIQSNSQTILDMKNNKSYNRLISYNKTIILLSAIIVLVSTFVNFVINDKEKECLIAQIIGAITLGLFVWDIVNTFIFVRLFYMLINTVEK